MSAGGVGSEIPFTYVDQSIMAEIVDGVGSM